MGFFGGRGSAATAGNYTNVLEGLDSIEPRYENFDESALATIVEAEENYNNIMQAVAIDELDFFEENGVEMVYTEASAGGFLNTVKEFFKNLYQKIKGLFEKFIALIDSYTKSDKEFVNKYRRQLLTVNTKDFEYKGFEFDKLDANIEKAMGDAFDVTGLPKLSSATVSVDLKAVEDRSETVEKMRGTASKVIGGAGGSLEAGEFSKEIFMAFRKGEDSKVEIDHVDVTKQLSIILNAKESKTKAEKAFKALEKELNQALKDLDKAEKVLVKATPDKTKTDDENTETSTAVKAVSTIIFFLKESLSIGQTINGALLTALKDQNRQAKSICVSLMNYSPKKESGMYTESGMGDSALGTVVIK